jgi:hypothetical protein
MIGFRCVAWLLALGAAVAAAAEAPATGAPSEPPLVAPGFGGVYRTNAWTPLELAWPSGPTGDEGQVFVSVEDADGQWVRMPAAAVEKAADGKPTARVTGRFGRPSGRALIETVGGATHAVAFAPPLPSTDECVLVLGDLPGLARAVRLLARDDGPRARVAALPDDRSWQPQSPRDFDGIDAVVVCGRRVRDADAVLLAGIDGWVRRGGRLVFLAGASAGDVAAAGPAAAWLPGAVDRMVPLRRLGAIETYARSPRPLDKAAIAGLTVPLFADPAAIAGVVEAHDGPTTADLPLVVRRAHGLGTITWIGLDLDAGGFRDWPGSDTLLVEALGGMPAGARGKEAGRAGETNRLALDLAGQLRRGIDRFPGVRAVPFEIVALLGMAIIASLFPLHWWLARGASPWQAWLTLPLLVCALTAVVAATAARWHGNAWHRSGASVVDIDAASRLARGTGWAGVWAPANAALDVRAAPAGPLTVADPDTAVGWWADSGRGLGATDAPVAHPSLATTSYGYGDSLAALAGVPIAASSSRLFEAEWVATLAAAPATSRLVREAQGTLRGSCAHHLPFALDGCVFVHGGWLYDVGRLEPDSAFDPSASRGPRSLAATLTRRTQSKDRDVTIRWNTADDDVARILEIAGFHAAAGGSGFTSLEPGRLGRLDLSPLVAVDRAVLVGRGPPGVDWTVIRRMTGVEALDPPPASSSPAVWRIVMPLETP